MLIRLFCSSSELKNMALRDIFKVLADENGRITSGKLRGFCKEMEVELTDEEIKEMIKAVEPGEKGGGGFEGLFFIIG